MLSKAGKLQLVENTVEDLQTWGYRKPIGEIITGIITNGDSLTKKIKCPQ